jgi:Tfp pilus assembly protein PilF
LENSRDREVGLAVFRFIAAAYPRSSKAQQRLGQAYLQAGQKADARKSLKRALEIDPANQEAQLALKRSE